MSSRIISMDIRNIRFSRSEMIVTSQDEAK